MKSVTFATFVRVVVTIALLLCVNCSLFGDPYNLHRAAYCAAYRQYLADGAYRQKIVTEWRHGNELLIKDGFAPVPHPYGPERLRKFGIESVPGATTDDR